MRIEIASTDTTTTINGCPVRLWHGCTEGGNYCEVLVASVGSADAECQAELKAALAEHWPPREVTLAELVIRSASPAQFAADLDAAEVAGLVGALRDRRPVDLSLSVSTAVELVSVIQLASRHPAARGSPTIRRVVDLARRLHRELEIHSPELGRLLERGWHEVWDVRTGPL
jgi:hypothetical protein